MAKRKTKLENSLVIECAWEVCNQVGGIYTVIRSKIPAMKDKWGDNYCLLGPSVNESTNAEFDPINEVDPKDVIAQSVAEMRSLGYDVMYGRWLVTGRPKAVLLNPNNAKERLKDLQVHYNKKHQIDILKDHDLLNEMLLWADLNRIFCSILSKRVEKGDLILHFHEWMSALPVLDLKHESIPCKTVFTTHATMLGRYLAMTEKSFYDDMSKYDWYAEAAKFNILPMVQIERAVANAVDSFSTVSQVTGDECINLLGKKPDVITPNGLNIQRFVASHEVQNLHQKYKDEIHDFTIGHFFHNKHFSLDKTLYFFTSGRYEYKNKGFDLTLDALKQLNTLMLKEKMDITVVMFFITRQSTWSVNPDALESRGVMGELKQTCEAIQKQIGERLFMKATESTDDFRLPDLNELVDDYWRLRYRRTIQSWKSDKWPIIVTHNLVNDLDDDILRYLRNNQLLNSPEDRVKIVYHPEFITSTNPLFGIDYTEFVRGCHLGIFPSYYEPWGYTPLECIASGVPTVTSDLSGFGRYANSMDKNLEEAGIYLLKRERRRYDRQVSDLTQFLYNFVKSDRRARIMQRNKAEDFSENFDWKVLRSSYEKAYNKALKTN